MLLLDDKLLLEKKRQDGVMLSRGDFGEAYKSDVRKSAYRFMLVALAAKLAVCDSAINKDELRSFPEIFKNHLGRDIAYSKMMMQAAVDPAPIDHFISRIKAFYPNNNKLYKAIILQMISFAAVDGVINSKEMMFLRDVTYKFDIADSFFMRALRIYIVPEGKTAFNILAVEKNVSRDVLKRMYYKNVQEYHPDRLAIFAVSDPIMEMANERMQILNKAYKAICHYRKFK